jgi:vancomycin resistance protein YoaR
MNDERPGSRDVDGTDEGHLDETVADADAEHVVESDELDLDLDDNAPTATWSAADDADAGEHPVDELPVDEHAADEPAADEPAADEAGAGGAGPDRPADDPWAHLFAPAGDAPHQGAGADEPPADGADVEEEGSGRHWGRWALLTAVVALGALYVGGYFLTGNRLPADTTVAGVEVGGLSPAAARTTLEEELGPREDEPVVLVHGDDRFEVDPSDAGLALDVDASVAEAGGQRSWDPRDMAALVLGSRDRDPVLDVDEKALDAAVKGVAEGVDVPVTEALITFPDAEPRTREPKAGLAVRADDTADLVRAEYLVQDDPAEVPTAPVEPAVDEAGLADALETIAKPAVAAPVTIEVGRQDVELPVTAYAPALRVEPVDGAMTPVIDPDRLAEPLTDATTGIGRKAVDATVEIRDEKPVVVPGRSGIGLQPQEMAEKLVPVLTKTGDERSVQVEAKVVRPAFTTKQAKALRITEKISEFTTEYPHAEYRNINQGRAAELINGTIVKPGETFSFNDTVGERTAANGFTTGSVINGGRFRDELGGGVSQVVTTTYNAAFFAGLDDVEHHPHAFYIDRYPVGREATVYFGSLDLRFRNNLESGVLIRAFVQPSGPGGIGRTTVQMWGTKQYDVEAGQSARRNVRTPATRYDDSPSCTPQGPLQGFDIDIYRTIRQDGKVVKRETDTANYQAADQIICGKEPKKGKSDD